jgi:hypothetical protein
LVVVDEKCAYIRNTFDIGPECRSCATKKADVLRTEVVIDYVDRTTSNLAYLVFGRWARRHVVVVCRRNELPLGVLL